MTISGALTDSGGGNESSKPLKILPICLRTYILADSGREPDYQRRVQGGVENLLVLLMNKPGSALPLRSS
jgi:hypothetical protein